MHDCQQRYVSFAGPGGRADQEVFIRMVRRLEDHRLYPVEFFDVLEGHLTDLKEDTYFCVCNTDFFLFITWI